MADRLHAAVAQFGLPPEYDAGKYADDNATVYDIDAAERFLNTLVVIDGIFEDHRAALEGECSPVQLWPHGFDLAFEWFGTRQVQHEENGRMETYPSQLNLGFYPGNEENEAYFYSNPFPFDEAALTSHALPAAHVGSPKAGRVLTFPMPSWPAGAMRQHASENLPGASMRLLRPHFRHNSTPFGPPMIPRRQEPGVCVLWPVFLPR